MTLSYLTADATNQEYAAIYWASAICGMSLSVLGTHFITKWELQRKIANQGLMQAVFDTMERFYDPNCNIHNEGNAIVPSLCDSTLFEMLSVTIYGWGITGSLLCSKAITYTIYSAVPGWDDVEQDDGVVKDKEQIYVIWLALLICFAITFAMTAYVGRLLNGIQRARRSLFGVLTKKMKKTAKETQSVFAVHLGVNLSNKPQKQ